MAFTIGPAVQRQNQTEVRSMALAALERTRGILRSFTRGPFNLKDAALTKYFSSGKSAAGVVVNEWTAMNYAAFFAGVSLISGHMGAFPLFLYKRTKAPNGRYGKERYETASLFRIIHDEWNEEMTSQAARETMQAWALTWGNGYAEIERSAITNAVVALWVITPDRVTPFREDVLAPNGQTRKGALKYRVKNPGQEDSILTADKIVHLHGLGFDGITGYSVIEKARASIGLALAAERSGEAFFGNGQTFGGILSTEGDMDETELNDARKAIEAVHQGPDRAHRFLLLKNGLKYESIGVKPGDAQFLESRKFQIEEIARWLNLPPHKLKDLDRSTNNNIEHQGIEYYTDTLYPWQVRWEQELNRKLISPLERRQQFIEHLVDGVLRGDIQTRYAAYAIGRQWGWLCADDIRGFENMNPLESGGDVFLSPLNMAPADLLDDLVEAQIAKTKRVGTGPTTTPPAGAEPGPADVQPGDEQKDAEDLLIELRTARAQLRVLALAAHDAGTILRAEREALANALRDGETVELERESARQAATAAEAELAQRTGELATAIAQVATLEQRVAGDATAAAELTRELEIARTALETEGAALITTREQLAAAEARVLEAQASADARAAELETVRGELEQLRTSADAAAGAAAQTLEARDASILEHTGERDRLAAELEAAQARADQAAGELSAARLELEQLRASTVATLADRDAAALEHVAERDRLAAALETAQQRADSTAGELAAARLEFEQQQATAAARAEDLERLTAEASERYAAEAAAGLARAAELEAAQARADAADAERARIAAAMAEQDADTARQLAEMHQAVEQARTNETEGIAAAVLAGEQLRDGALDHGNATLARVRDEAAAELEAQRAELEAARVELETAHAAQVLRLSAEGAEAVQRADQARGELEQLRAEHATASAAAARDLEVHQAELASTREELTNARATADALAGQVEELRIAHAADGGQLIAIRAELETERTTAAARLAELEAEGRTLAARGEQLAADQASAALAMSELEAAHGEELARRDATEAAHLAELERLRPDASEMPAQRIRADLAENRNRELEAAALAESATAAEQLRQATEAAQAAARADVVAVRTAELERLANMIQAHRAIFVDPMARMIHREAERVRSRAKTRERLNLWTREFYPGHEATMVEALLPVVRVHLVWSGSAEDPATVTRREVRNYIAQSIRLFDTLGAADAELPEAIDQLVASWETVRAEAFADRLLREEIDYVRAYRI